MSSEFYKKHDFFDAVFIVFLKNSFLLVFSCVCSLFLNDFSKGLKVDFRLEMLYNVTDTDGEERSICRI